MANEAKAKKKASDFRYNTGETKVPWAAVGENYNAEDLMTIIKFMMTGHGEAYDAALQAVEDAEEEIDNLTEALREHHVDRLKNRKCSAKNGMLYLDLLTNLERIGDHAENIATSVDKKR